MAEQQTPMTLEEACAHWGIKQSEVDFITSEYEGKSWWQNRRTMELIECGEEIPSPKPIGKKRRV